MESLENRSGTWVGFWTQGPIKGHMRFDLFFNDGSIEGGGSDRDGIFRMGGRYESSGSVDIFKRYSNLVVMYTGTWDGRQISGTSLISDGLFLDEGSFEIWPEGEEMLLSREAMIEVVTASS